ncbi:MAG: acetyltransferase [Sedimentisphaerales bacterium]
MSELIIFGAGDIAEIAYYYFTHDSEHTVAGFVVDKEYRKGDNFLSLPLIDFEVAVKLYPPEKYKMFIALSYAKMNKIRAEKFYKAKELDYQLVSYLSSRCSYLTDNPIGENCFILEDNTIQPFVKIGNNVTLWSGNHIGHHSVIEDHCFISSHVVVSGHVHINKYCFIGVNVSLHNAIRIAPETLIGAGSVITADTVEKSVYVPPRTTLLRKKSDDIEFFSLIERFSYKP